MSTLNKEIYEALLEAGTKASASLAVESVCL